MLLLGIITIGTINSHLWPPSVLGWPRGFSPTQDKDKVPTINTEKGNMRVRKTTTHSNYAVADDWGIWAFLSFWARAGPRSKVFWATWTRSESEIEVAAENNANCDIASNKTGTM
ncbi:hypothetical protein BC832DRAFT_228038 [Gaertneriomyces semiglobifer]|nr:hypothetical protein BC832DRAFT_228038 [Gaertneriomyces semiglobifer]